MEAKKKSSLRLNKILGYILGAFSLTNLLEEITLITLMGKIKIWMDAYSSFVERIGHFLFDWFSSKWINVSPIEMHLIILNFIFFSTMSKALYRRNVETKKNDKFMFLNFFNLHGTGAASVMLFAVFLFYAIFFIDPFGIFFMSILSIILIIICISQKYFWSEFIGILTIFIIIISLNYTIFR